MVASCRNVCLLRRLLLRRNRSRSLPFISANNAQARKPSAQNIVVQTNVGSSMPTAVPQQGGSVTTAHVQQAQHHATKSCWGSLKPRVVTQIVGQPDCWTARSGAANHGAAACRQQSLNNFVLLKIKNKTKKQKQNKKNNIQKDDAKQSGGRPIAVGASVGGSMVGIRWRFISSLARNCGMRGNRKSRRTKGSLFRRLQQVS